MAGHVNGGSVDMHIAIRPRQVALLKPSHHRKQRKRYTAFLALTSHCCQISASGMPSMTSIPSYSAHSLL